MYKEVNTTTAPKPRDGQFWLQSPFSPKGNTGLLTVSTTEFVLTALALDAWIEVAKITTKQTFRSFVLAPIV